MKSFVFLWAFISSFLVSDSFAQNTDSLLRILKDPSSDNHKKLTANSLLAWMYQSEGSFDTAIYYYQKLFQIPLSDTHSEFAASIYFGAASTYANINQNDSSIKYYQKALKLFSNLNNSEKVAMVSTNLSMIYKDQGAYDVALEFALTAAKLFERKGDSINLAYCYNGLATILTKSGNYIDANTYFRAALRLFVEFDAAYLARTYNNLGELFILLHQYDSANDNLLRSVSIKRELNDIKGLARTINNLGKVALLTGKLFEAEKNFNESLSIQKQVDDPIGLIEVLDNLGELYLITNRPHLALKILREAEALARRSGTPEYLRQNLELQVRLARVQHDFAAGMTHLEELLIIRDSLLNEEKSKSMQAMRIQYETEKKEQQIAFLEQREEVSRINLRNNQILITGLLVGLILVGLIGVLIYLNLRNARSAKARIELLLAETHHRIKNNLQMLASIFHLQTRHYTDQEMVLEAQASESRVHTMSLLHNRFSNTTANQTVNTDEYISDLVQKLADLYGGQSTNVQVTTEIQDIELDIDKAFALSLIIQELVCNAFKYAFHQMADPRLTVSLKSAGNRVSVVVKDNGIGLDRTLVGTSQGFSLVDALVSQLDGTMKAEIDNGTSITILFPIPQPWKKRLFS